MRNNKTLRRCLAAALLLCPLSAGAQDDGQAQPDPDTPAQHVDPIAAAIDEVNRQDNGVTINREELYVDVQAQVCLRSAEFLEMFMCTRDTREHESILVTDVQPSTIHFALLLLGQEPGSTLTYDEDFDPPRVVPPTGPEVEVFIVRQINGVDQETPARRWIVDTHTREMMQDNTWLFAGSQFANYQGNQIYHADINGSAISLVNFGDDLLTLPNELTLDNASHDMVWAPRTQVIPAVGTELTVRLRVQPAEQSPEAEEQSPTGESEPEAGGQAPEAAAQP